MGDVIENGQHVPLAERVWDELCDWSRLNWSRLR